MMNRKNRHLWSLAGAGLAISLAARALAQTPPPFIGGPVTAFDVQVKVIDSGALFDTEAVVSHDERYVTMNVQATNASLLALQEFRTQAVAVGGSGFVGGVNPSTNAGRTGRRLLPSEIDRRDRNIVSVLNRRGIFLLAPLK